MENLLSIRNEVKQYILKKTQGLGKIETQTNLYPENNYLVVNFRLKNSKSEVKFNMSIIDDKYMLPLQFYKDHALGLLIESLRKVA